MHLHMCLPQVKEALSLAYDAHSGQRRKSGEPFITHPVEVTRILAELKMDYECLVAGAGRFPAAEGAPGWERCSLAGRLLEARLFFVGMQLHGRRGAVLLAYGVGNYTNKCVWLAGALWVQAAGLWGEAAALSCPQ